MSENSLEMKVCPFCGQFRMTDLSDDIREKCECDGAKEYQRRNSAFLAKKEAIRFFCGDDCAKINARFEVLGDETIALLCDIARGVCFDQIKKVLVTLPDESTLSITGKSVKRTAKVVVEKEI